MLKGYKLENLPLRKIFFKDGMPLQLLNVMMNLLFVRLKPVDWAEVRTFAVVIFDG